MIQVEDILKQILKEVQTINNRVDKLEISQQEIKAEVRDGFVYVN